MKFKVGDYVIFTNPGIIKNYPIVKGIHKIIRIDSDYAWFGFGGLVDGWMFSNLKKVNPCKLLRVLINLKHETSD